jgi:uncharacterized protein
VRRPTALQSLSRDECLDLLRTVPVGRVGVSYNALPVILPVNFRLSDGDSIVFRSGEGQKLRASLDGSVIAFEADAFEDETSEAWSVLVQGVATVHELGRGNGHGLPDVDNWAEVEASHVIVLGTENISGRRLVPTGDLPT